MAIVFAKPIKEVVKLIENDFTRKAKYLKYTLNVVMVQKSNYNC